jgi:rhamnose utilization protein RhaD (predicted bifunctional aldolase and dehydrogenase)
MNEPLQQLISLTRTLGEPQRSYVIIGEGNTSYRVDDDTFWIKASGHGMENISEDGFVAVRIAPILALFETPDIDTDAMKQATKAAKTDSTSPVIPSIEVMFHAALLADCAARCIAHTHPVAVNQILCSSRAEQFAMNRIFPDEVVLCGPRSVFVPYSDPGLPLALAIRANVRAYMDEQGEAPKVILLQNHGLIALGQTPTEALNVTAMCVKAAHIFAGACAVGEPVFMSEADIYHIYRRPDEIYRRQRFVGTT